MPIDPSLSAGVALDGFADYYTEKLWAWIPEHYREQDANSPTPGTLRALVERLGAQAAAHRRKLDRLWENNFVELADDEVLAKLGELVATRMVHAANRRARRVDVARTIYYRRRKGTPRVLESLITDITGWGGVHIETRSRLARTAHLLEPSPDLRRGEFTRTPRGGVADLRSSRIPTLAWTAFEELSHTPDFRRFDEGVRGRYGVAKLGIHLYRMRAFKLELPTPVAMGSDATYEYWTLDPSGRDVPLFQPLDRPSADRWVKPREWQMPKQLDCRLLGHEEFEWNDAIIDELLLVDSVALLKKYSGWRARSALELRRLIESFPDGPAKTEALAQLSVIMAASLTADSGKRRLYGPDASSRDGALQLALGDTNPGVALPASEVMPANLSAWASNFSVPASVKAVVDPARGRVLGRVVDPRLLASYLHHGFPAEIGAGTYDRRFDIETVGVVQIPNLDPSPGPVPLPAPPASGIEEIVDNKTYVIAGDYTGIVDYRLQAANGTRPYLVYEDDLLQWQIIAANDGEAHSLVLEGLWIGIVEQNRTIGDPDLAKLVIDGVWDRVLIRHCTLDPGGRRAEDANGVTYSIPYLQIEVKGQVAELIIESSITGPIVEQTSEADPCSIGKLVIRDSIVSAVHEPSLQAISTKIAEVHVERSTILGGISVNRLFASDSVIALASTITDLQSGCFRFSAGVQGDWPHPFESYFFAQFKGAWLESSRFGDPEFARLSEATPDEILRGAENHCTMGAFNHLIDPIRRDDFIGKFEEFVPFGLIPQLDIEN